MTIQKSHRFARFLFFIIALQVLNMSIDVPATQINNIASPGDFNYVDSYVEFVAEVVMQIENAIPEQKHRQHKELQMHKQMQVICQQVGMPMQAVFQITRAAKGYPAYLNNYHYQLTRDISHPPSFFS